MAEKILCSLIVQIEMTGFGYHSRGGFVLWGYTSKFLFDLTDSKAKQSKQPLGYENTRSNHHHP